MAGADADGSYDKVIKIIYSQTKNGSLRVNYQEYEQLLQIDEIFRNIAFSFTRNGSYLYATYYVSAYRGKLGLYWTPRMTYNNKAEYLSFNSVNIYTRNNFTKDYGMAVRCIAK